MPVIKSLGLFAIEGLSSEAARAQERIMSRSSRFERRLKKTAEKENEA
jgi:hypothetical protein